jgi:hypothetical protein
MALYDGVLPLGYEPNDLNCWVCGKPGVNDNGLLTCYRHEEGLVRWNAYGLPERRLNTAVVSYGVAIPVIDHAEIHMGHPA